MAGIFLFPNLGYECISFQFYFLIRLRLGFLCGLYCAFPFSAEVETKWCCTPNCRWRKFCEISCLQPYFLHFSFLSAKKVEEDTGDYHIDRVSTDFCRALAEARRNKGMTQAQLAQAINEKPSVVSEYESGKVGQQGDGPIARL